VFSCTHRNLQNWSEASTAFFTFAKLLKNTNVSLICLALRYYRLQIISFSGSVGIICAAMGILVSGVVITKFKPRSRYLAAWNVFVEMIDVIGHLCYGFLTCSVDDLHGEKKPDNRLVSVPQ